MNEKNDSEEQADLIKTRGSFPLQRWVSWLAHLFGQHNSSCRVAGAWRMWDHKKLRGPFCIVTKMPLLLPKNRKR